MELIGFFIWIIVYCFWKGYDVHRNKKIGSAYASRYHPTGFALEYKITCDEFRKLKNEFDELRETHKESDSLEIMKSAHGFCPDWICRKDVILYYAIVKARVECYNIGMWPICMFDCADLVWEHPVDIIRANIIYTPIMESQTFNQKTCDRLLERDIGNYRKYLSVMSSHHMEPEHTISIDEYKELLK